MEHRTHSKTKAALIRAAERLFAERGLSAVSVRDITRAAGARNESALHYHFGGMEALVKEVFAARYLDIEVSRLARIAKIDSAQAGNDIQALMEAAMGPLLEACLDEEGRLYARFSVQLATDPRFDVTELIRGLGMQSVATIRDRLVVCLGNLSEDILATRLRRIFTISLIVMADYARLIEAGNAPTVEDATREAAASLSGFLQTTPSHKKS